MSAELGYRIAGAVAGTVCGVLLGLLLLCGGLILYLEIKYRRGLPWLPLDPPPSHERQPHPDHRELQR
jgi:hypothetical protein